MRCHAFQNARGSRSRRWRVVVAETIPREVLGSVKSTQPVVASVASVFIFRRRQGWQKLGVVSFAYPLMPLLFVATGIWMTILGLKLRPGISLIAAATVAIGALVYRFRIRSTSA